MGGTGGTQHRSTQKGRIIRCRAALPAALHFSIVFHSSWATKHSLPQARHIIQPHPRCIYVHFEIQMDDIWNKLACLIAIFVHFSVGTYWIYF